MSRKELPRTYELWDLIENHQDFENSIQVEPLKKQIWSRREREFKKLDIDSWKFLKREVKDNNYLIVKEPNGRGWEQLISILNQARAHNHLIDAGCTDVQFIHHAKGKSGKRPDLKGNHDGVIVLCEVKTMNKSLDEIYRRKKGEVQKTENQLSVGFFNKLNKIIDKANTQIEDYICKEYGTVENIRRIIFIIPNFDDSVGDYKSNYYEQIDKYLGDNPNLGIELVFYNGWTPIHHTIKMTNASIINEVT